MELIDKLTALRKESKLSQKELAKKLKIGQSTICQWELGIARPNYDAIAKLCEFYDISADYLCGFVDERGCYVKQYKGLNAEQEMYVNMLNNLDGAQRNLILELMEEFLNKK
ncbi:MAG: helix-turn-helix transcriptional regulator [Clostridia bacterium]